MAAFDFKKEFRDLYMPRAQPSMIDVGPATFLAVAGTGDPNEEDGAYSRALETLYALCYTIKMSKKGDWQPEGYFDYVVPPLEGLWWAEARAFDGTGIADKSALSWVSLIRQPDFVTDEVLTWAIDTAARKKPQQAEALRAGTVRLVRFAEGACAQIMHHGPYDDEPQSIAKLTAFIESAGMEPDIANPERTGAGAAPLDGSEVLDALDRKGAPAGIRLHHEIYLDDPRRTKPEKLRTVIRHPVR